MRLLMLVEVPESYDVPALLKRLQPDAAPVTPNTPVAPPVTQPVATAGAPTKAQLEEAVKAYGMKRGFDQARKLIDEYAPGKKVHDVPVDKQAELYARLTA